MNAVILAAGFGTRLKPLTDEVPKPLIVIGRETIIERQIRFLKEAGVESIYIVIGYKKEHFRYLEHKYDQIHLIINPLYDNTNNMYSLYLCKDILADTWIIEADVYVVNNFFKRRFHSTYFTALKPIVNYEWYFNTNEGNRILQIVVADTRLEPAYKGTELHILSGISYWTHRDSIKIAEKLAERFLSAERTQRNQQLYWDQIIYDNIEYMDIYTHVTSPNDWFEIDTLDDLEKLRDLLDCDSF